MADCVACTADDREEREAVGVEALAGTISWREAARKLGLTHHAGFKNHMENHYVAPLVALRHGTEVTLATAIESAVAELHAQARVAPPDVRPLLLVAAHNLAGLADTKPSQQSLIAALKAVNDITGMRQEQRLLVEFARHAFGVHPVIEVEAIEE